MIPYEPPYYPPPTMHELRDRFVMAHLEKAETLLECAERLQREMQKAASETLYHYRCTKCFGIVGTEEADVDQVRCICGGKLRTIKQ